MTAPATLALNVKAALVTSGWSAMSSHTRTDLERIDDAATYFQVRIDEAEAETSDSNASTGSRVVLRVLFYEFIRGSETEEGEGYTDWAVIWDVLEPPSYWSAITGVRGVRGPLEHDGQSRVGRVFVNEVTIELQST